MPRGPLPKIRVPTADALPREMKSPGAWKSSHAVALALVALVGSYFLIVATPIRNFDLWWHLSVGQQVVEQGGLYQQETLSYPLDGNSVVHKWGWLSDVLLYSVWSLGGSWGLIALKALSVAAIVLTLAHIGLKRLGRSRFAVLVLITAGLYLCAPRILVRPHLIQYVVSLIVLDLLVGFKQKQCHRAIFAIPLLQLIAINLSPSGLLCLGLVGLFFVGELLESLPKKTWKEAATKRRLLTLGALTLCCGIASLVSPDGLKILNMFKEAAPAARPWHTDFQFTVGEWASPFHPQAVQSGMALILVSFLVFAGGLALWKIGQVRVTYLLLLIVSSAMAITALRHSLNLATVGVVGLMAYLPARGLRLSLPSSVAFAGGVVALGLFCSYYHTALAAKSEHLESGLGAMATEMRDATHELEKVHPKATVFNFMALGGGLTWFSEGRIRNFIDGRLTNPRHLDEHNTLYFGARAIREAKLEEYGIDTLVLDKLKSQNDALRYPNHILLDAMDEEWRAQWNAVYNGDHVIVWVRN